MSLVDRIKFLVHDCGFHACGIARPEVLAQAEKALQEWTAGGKHGEMKYLENYEERKNRFWSQFPDAKSIIVLGVNYYSTGSAAGQVSDPKNGNLFRPEPVLGRTGKVARYAWGKDYHQVISGKIEEIKNKIRNEIGESFYCESAVDTKPLLEKTLGQQAGLGFIGKQTQLLSLQFGPWLFLSELITNLPLEPDEAFIGSCGTCRLCIDECPTGAIEADGHLDARKCISYLTIEHKSAIPIELRDKIGGHLFGCDDCLNVCPYVAKQKETDWKELTSEQGYGPEMDLIKLFEIKSNREYERSFKETAISRASRKQLLRNAAVVLGNIGSKEALPTLKRALTENDLIKEHAEWAIQKIEKNT